MIIHHYNSDGIIDFTTNLDCNQVPENFTNLPLPEITNKQALKYENNQIVIVSNYSVVYNTITKEPKEVKPGYILQENETDLQPTQFSVWENNNWVYSETLEKNYLIEKLSEIIEKNHKDKLWSGVNVQDYIIRVDKDSKNEISAVATQYQLFGVHPTEWVAEYKVLNGQKIEGSENARLPLNADNLMNFFITTATFYSNCFFERRDLLDSLVTKTVNELKQMEAQYVINN